MFTFAQSAGLWHSGTEHHTAGLQLFLRSGVRRLPQCDVRVLWHVKRISSWLGAVLHLGDSTSFHTSAEDGERLSRGNVPVGSGPDQRVITSTVSLTKGLGLTGPLQAPPVFGNLVCSYGPTGNPE